MTLHDACDAYLRDMEARHLSVATRRSYKSVFRIWQSYAGEHGLAELNSFDRTAMHAWRESWICKPGTQLKRLQQLKAFFAHAMQVGWMTASPLSGLKPPRSRSKPTMPLSRDEFRALVAAAADKPKEQALLLLMRFSGLSVRDAVTLNRDAIDGHSLTLRRAKSGELVMVYLPGFVRKALERIKRPEHTNFFWSGSSMPDTTANYWRARLNLAAHKAGVEGFRTHRLRDTFAVELLLGGLAIQDASTLLGHSSVSTMEKYYAPWNVARRDRLYGLVRKTYECDPSVLSFDGCILDNNNTRAVAAALVQQPGANSSTKLIQNHDGYSV